VVKIIKQDVPWRQLCGNNYLNLHISYINYVVTIKKAFHKGLTLLSLKGIIGNRNNSVRRGCAKAVFPSTAPSAADGVKSINGEGIFTNSFLK
jgi:hypothetical protein